MEFNLDLTPATIEAALIAAIMQSSLGKLMSERLVAALSNYDIRNAIDQTIKSTVVGLVSDAVRGDKAITMYIRERVKVELTEASLTKTVEQITRKFEEAARDY